YVWIDVEDEGGNSETSAWFPVTVSLPWKIDGVTLSESSVTLGAQVFFSAAITGDTTGFKYSYAWSYEGGRDDWNSTKKETGGMTTATQGDFYALHPGTYHVWFDVEDTQGNVRTSDVFYVTVTIDEFYGTWNAVTFYSRSTGLVNLADYGLTATVTINRNNTMVLGGDLFEDMDDNTFYWGVSSGMLVFAQNSPPLGMLTIVDGQLKFYTLGGDDEQFIMMCDKV
ncbi:MAG: hypothetical protein IJJ14_08515, partial [Coriobacteriales bacterium]|nr:hypothetical protein [Coriobacteriales bacterium]